MPCFILRLLTCFTVVLISFTYKTTKNITQISAEIKNLKYLGVYEIPYDFKYKKTTVGGLSGIDFDVENDLYYLINDFRSEKDPKGFALLKFILPNTIKLFFADLNGATGISLLTLKENHTFIRARKSLLLNMDDPGIYTDNIEGVNFGPLLPNGHKSLLFIADNNFKSIQK